MMKRSQIYLPLDQWRLLSVIADQTHQSVSGLIRRAIDKSYRRGEGADFEAALRAIRRWDRA